MNGKLTVKSLIVLLLAVGLASGCLLGCSQQPASSGEGASASSSAAMENAMSVAVEIDPSAADGKVDLPAADLALISEDVDLSEGASAYDALVATGAVIEGDSYVTSINGLNEKAAGPTYGWMYEVNGEAPTVAASECELQPGDVVRWYYASWDAS